MNATISHDSETPANGQQVITACAFIHHNIEGSQKLFLPKRADTKKFLPGVYELPGGHIDYGEVLIEGLKREVSEEFGMNISVGDPFFAFTYTNHIKGSHSLEIVYFAQFTDPLVNISYNKEDHSEFVWVTENDIDQYLKEKKVNDDPEYKAIKKGFSLLAGIILNFG